eukprot:s768_g5.t1
MGKGARQKPLRGRLYEWVGGSLGTWTGCPRCTGDVMQVLFPREGQSLSMVIPYREHWRIDLRNFMAGRRAEDYLVEDRLGRAICAAGDLEHVEEDQFPLRVFRLQDQGIPRLPREQNDAPSPNLCLIWCDWLHRQSSRVTCLALIVLLCLAMGAIFAQQMLLIALGPSSRIQRSWVLLEDGNDIQIGI